MEKKEIRVAFKELMDNYDKFYQVWLETFENMAGFNEWFTAQTYRDEPVIGPTLTLSLIHI